MLKQSPRIVRTSSDLPANHWMRRQLQPDTSLRGYAEDRAVSLLTRAALEAIEGAGLSRADVARALGTTKSYISQVLNGSTNMTLKTLGALLWASGRQVSELRSDVVGATAPTQPPAPKRAIVVTTSASDWRLAFPLPTEDVQLFRDYTQRVAQNYSATAQ